MRVAGGFAAGFALFVLALIASAAVSPAGHASPAASPAAIDVVLAFDGTASMKSSIAQAKQDATRLIAGMKEVDATLRIGVVVFRDYRNPAGEYELLQPLTDDVSTIPGALDRVRAVHNPDPANGVAESYSLLFRRSYSDPAIGWRSGARKILVVIGDAEPYGAGSGGLAECGSDEPDPHGLDASAELARMRASQIVLLMVRQVSAETSATLGCYEALAQRAALGSAARDGGGGGSGSDLVEPVVSLVKQVLAPLRLTQTTDRPLRRLGKIRYALTLTNRSSVPMRVEWLRTSLPRSFKYEGASTTRSPKRRGTSSYSLLVWHLNRALAPGRSVKISFTVRPTKKGKYRATARGVAKLESGLRIDLATRAPKLIALN